MSVPVLASCWAPQVWAMGIEARGAVSLSKSWRGRGSGWELVTLLSIEWSECFWGTGLRKEVRAGWVWDRGERVHISVSRCPSQTCWMQPRAWCGRCSSGRSTWPCRCRASALPPAGTCSSWLRSPWRHAPTSRAPTPPCPLVGPPIPVLLRVPWHPSHPEPCAQEPQPASFFPASWHTGRRGRGRSCPAGASGPGSRWPGRALALTPPSSPLQMPRCTHQCWSSTPMSTVSRAPCPRTWAWACAWCGAWFMCTPAGNLMSSKRGVGCAGGCGGAETKGMALAQEGPQGLLACSHRSSPYTPAAQRWSCHIPTCRNLWQMSMC